MIKFHELKVGDIVLAEYAGHRSEGEVIEMNAADREFRVQDSVQDFWYTPDQVFPIALDEQQLEKFNFEKEELVDGTVKYKRGPFRILLSEKENFSHFEMWYREDRRHITHPLSVHELQNHYRQMTKIELTRGVQAH